MQQSAVSRAGYHRAVMNKRCRDDIGKEETYRRQRDSGDGTPARATCNLENFSVLTRTLAAGAGFVR